MPRKKERSRRIFLKKPFDLTCYGTEDTEFHEDGSLKKFRCEMPEKIATELYRSNLCLQIEQDEQTDNLFYRNMCTI